MDRTEALITMIQNDKLGNAIQTISGDNPQGGRPHDNADTGPKKVPRRDTEVDANFTSAPDQTDKSTSANESAPKTSPSAQP